MCSVRLNIWDIGGQATLRPYWQNYYERTDALLWVVDSSDVGRMEICRDELHGLLKEEKLVGATLLILANKQDLNGALPAAKIKQVSSMPMSSLVSKRCSQRIKALRSFTCSHTV